MKVQIIDCKGSDASLSYILECDYFTTDNKRLKVFKDNKVIVDLPIRFFGIVVL